MLGRKRPARRGSTSEGDAALRGCRGGGLAWPRPVVGRGGEIGSEVARRLDAADEGRPLHQAIEIGRKARMARAERRDHRCVEEWRAGRAVGKAELAAAEPSGGGQAAIE